LEDLLGIVMEHHDTFVDLVDEALRVWKNLNITTPNVDQYLTFFDFLVDDNVKAKDDLNFARYNL
jgi:hypothetical protein